MRLLDNTAKLHVMSSKTVAKYEDKWYDAVKLEHSIMQKINVWEASS